MELKEKGYADTEKLYDDLYRWNVNIVANKEQNDYENNIDSFKAGDVIYFHFYLEGGTPEQKIPLKVRLSDSDNQERIFENEELWSDGNNGEVSTGTRLDFEGSIKCEVISEQHILAEKTVYIHDKKEMEKDVENEEAQMQDIDEEIQGNIENESSASRWRDKKIYIDYVEYELDVSTLQSFLDNGWYKIDEELFSYDINYAIYTLAKDEKEIHVSFSDEYTLGKLTLKEIQVGTNSIKNYQEGVQQIKMTAFGFSEDLIFNGFSKDEIIKNMGGLEPYGKIVENTQDGIIVNYDDERNLIFTAWYCNEQLYGLGYQHYGY